MSSNRQNTKIIISKVSSFHLNWDAGDMYMNALESCLKFIGQECAYWWLAGVSGDAFKFIYDKDDVREPMRDRVPIDTVSLACSAMGWRGIWCVDEKIEIVINHIKESLKQNIPVLTTNLVHKWYHGANIITGIDDKDKKFFLQIGREDVLKPYSYEKIPIPESWDGPIPGPITWANNPIFLLKEIVNVPGEEKIISKSLTQAVELQNIKSLPYKDHPGAQKYSTPLLTGKTARCGRSAFKELKDEIMHSVITWPVIWRITTQCGQLSYDRSNAAKFLKTFASKYPQYSNLDKISDLFNETMNNANTLKKSYWDDRLNHINNPETFLKEMYGSYSFVYNISSLEGDKLKQFRKILPVMETLWGPAVILDSSTRRMYNLKLINAIINAENHCFKLLERFIE